MFELFHLQHPHWLWALLPLSLLLWLLLKSSQHNNPWKKVVDAHLLPLLMASGGGQISRLPIILLAIAWLLSVLALADPVWEKQPRPLFQAQQARVIVLDLSRSMYITDIKPSRLVRARFKLLDVLTLTEETETGLVVFAGDAFVVSPLTRDAKTINNLITALEPSIMPIQGSRADLGLEKAAELLAQAGVTKGEVLLIADGFDDQQTIEAAKMLQAKGYTLSVLGIGTAEGGVLRGSRGEVLHTRTGESVNVTFDSEAMQQLAAAGGGRYSTLTSGDDDLNHLLPSGINPLNHNETEATDQKSDSWKSEGPYLVLLLLPLAALAFRRGWLLSVMLLVGIALPPEPAMAFGWDDLWQRRDQQTVNALQQGDFQRATELANDPALKGTAAYRQKDYESALEAFSTQQGANGNYNRGNALAQLGRYQEAIEAYDEALKQAPNMEDAKLNRAEVERLLQQQEQQKQDQEQNEENKEQQKQDQEQNEENEENKEGQKSESDNKEEQQGEQDPSDEQKEGKPEEQKSEESKASEEEKKGEQQTAENEASDEKPEDQAEAEAEPLNQEEQQAIEQWLRRIPDDPAGLLRRKFKYQYSRRPPRSGTGSDRPW